MTTERTGHGSVTKSVDEATNQINTHEATIKEKVTEICTQETDDNEQSENYPEKPQRRDEDKGATPKDTKSRTDTDALSRPSDQGARPKQRAEEKTYTAIQNPDRKEDKEKNANETSGKKTHAMKQGPSGENKDRSQEARVKSIIQVQGKSAIIMSIVPVDNNKMFIVQREDRELTLIDGDGKVIKKSVPVNVGDYILDVKLYNSDLMITCDKGQKVIRMSSDGASTSMLRDLSPHYTRGLCVGYSDDLLVSCVKYTSSWSIETGSGKVVRLDQSGSIVQTIQYDHTGAPLFTEPFRLTSLPSGVVMVTDTYKVIAVDREGGHLFTWDGEKERVKGDKQYIFSITHDRHNNVFVTDLNNHKVYVIGREGRGGKCLLDSGQGILFPWGLAVNHDGQLLVGCYGGNIHVAEY